MNFDWESLINTRTTAKEQTINNINFDCFDVTSEEQQDDSVGAVNALISIGESAGLSEGIPFLPTNQEFLLTPGFQFNGYNDGAAELSMSQMESSGYPAISHLYPRTEDQLQDQRLGHTASAVLGVRQTAPLDYLGIKTASSIIPRPQLLNRPVLTRNEFAEQYYVCPNTGKEHRPRSPKRVLEDVLERSLVKKRKEQGGVEPPVRHPHHHSEQNEEEEARPKRKSCSVPGCTKVARGRLFCCSHGGGKRCEANGCEKSAIGATHYCSSHGGGRKCQHEGCNTGSRPNSAYCIKHGGGKLCQQEGCQRVSRARTIYCSRHGGGVRCAVTGCSKAAVSVAVAMCRRHHQKVLQQQSQTSSNSDINLETT